MADDDLSSFFDEVEKVSKVASEAASSSYASDGDTPVAGPAAAPAVNHKKRKREDEAAKEQASVVKVTKFVAPVKSTTIAAADAASSTSGSGGVSHSGTSGAGLPTTGESLARKKVEQAPSAKDRKDWHSMTEQERALARKALRRKTQRQYALEAAKGQGTVS